MDHAAAAIVPKPHQSGLQSLRSVAHHKHHSASLVGVRLNDPKISAHGSPSQPTDASTFTPSKPDIGRKKTIVPSIPVDAPSHGHVTQMKRIFQATKACLHRDMFVASSPVSSIECRMNIDLESVAHGPSIDRTAEVDDEETGTKSWRYSTAPLKLAVVSVDVREPLPAPTLLEVTTYSSTRGSDGVEPVSSGFCSTDSSKVDLDTEATRCAATSSCSREALPEHIPLKDSDIHQEFFDKHETELDQHLRELKVDSDETEESNSEPPVASHLKRRSCANSMEVIFPNSPKRGIYLSEAAETAAESAKTKRRLLTGILDDTRALQTTSPSALEDVSQLASPDPALARANPTSPPSEKGSMSLSPLVNRPHSASDSDMKGGGNGMLPRYRPPGTSRATATGSPMPFITSRRCSSTAQAERNPSRQPNRVHMPNPAYFDSLDGHFEPGWYYAQEPIRPFVRPMYSFSTAASKVIGSNQPPDSRIRDSYKTETLTALVKPPSRYRKNVIGAEVAYRGVSCYHPGPKSSLMPPSTRSRPSSRQTYAGQIDVRLRSSPPCAPSSEQHVPGRRKRAVDDSFVIVEDFPAPDVPVGARSSSNILDEDEETRAAVRLSIFGTSTPEVLLHAREGIKELSLNVQLHRKGTQHYNHQRKKRRPSYWDNDIKEIRQSPARRGGVNSPVSAKQSMRAEFEIASLGNNGMEVDEDDTAGEIGHNGIHTDSRLGMA